MQIYQKENQKRVFLCKYSETFKISIFDKTPLVAASVHIFIVLSKSYMNPKATYMEGVNEEFLLLHCPYIATCLQDVPRLEN